jgi:hypothetical protein
MTDPDPVASAQAEHARRGIVNTWDQVMAAGGTGVVISYRPYQHRAPGSGPKWRVWRLVEGEVVVTDPKAAWYNYGQMTFPCHYPLATGKKAALVEAIAWAEATYGKQDFVRNRMGDYLPRAINAAHPLRKETR